MFGKLRKEPSGDPSISELCAGLQDLGTGAQRAERGRPEEKFTWWRGDALGVIDIPEGPIRWVTLKCDESEYSTTCYSEYGIPDPQVVPGVPKVWLMTVHLKSFPLLGKVVDLQWRGQDSQSGLIDRLMSDFSTRQAIMNIHALEIETYPSHGSWILTAWVWAAPSTELWDCYQAIARQLLATTIPTNP